MCQQEACERVEVVPESHGVTAVLNKAFAGAESVAWVVPPDPKILLRPTVAREDRRTQRALALSISLAVKSDEESSYA
jgi:hypothetical protein